MSQLLGVSLYEMERNTEILMLDAARVVSERERRYGLQSTDQLRKLAAQLGVTHIFEIDAQGRFLRSTNESPKLIPNLFGFCSEYRDFIKGREEFRKTPIIPPTPEPLPYKFLFVHSPNWKRLIEVGVRVDFLANRLTKAIHSDANVLAVNLFAPDGTPLGEFSRDGSRYGTTKIELPKLLPKTLSNPDSIEIFERVDSGQTSCCQCDKAGISRGGEYFYVFESVVSKAELARTLRYIDRAFVLLQLLACVVAWLMAYFIAGRLTSKVRAVAEQVKAIGQEDGFHKIGIVGSDEIAYLASEFNALLDRLDSSQQALLKADRSKALATLASQVAHDIRSPLAAFGALEPSLKNLPEEERVLARMAVGRIRDVANNLLKQYREISLDREEAEVEHIYTAVDAIVSEKRLQHQAKTGVIIELSCGPDCYALFAVIRLSDFKRVISNLIDNAVDALDNAGEVIVRISSNGTQAIVSIEDTGKGISPEILVRLERDGGSFGKARGSGIGLSHARKAVETWGGKLVIESTLNSGTRVAVYFPAEKPPRWFANEIRLNGNSPVVCLDDDPLIHEVWHKRLHEDASCAVTSFQSADSFINWHNESATLDDALFLIDLELNNTTQNGLDIIELTKKARQSILVTSHFEELYVRNRCEKMGVRLLPKPLAKWVPIHSSQQT